MRDFLKLPDNLMLFCGMALGHADARHRSIPGARLVSLSKLLCDI